MWRWRWLGGILESMKTNKYFFFSWQILVRKNYLTNKFSNKDCLIEKSSEWYICENYLMKAMLDLRKKMKKWQERKKARRGWTKDGKGGEDEDILGSIKSKVCF
jgi:hypothetical protein